MGDAPQHVTKSKGREFVGRTRVGAEMARFSAVISYGRVAKGHMRIKIGASRAGRKTAIISGLPAPALFQSQPKESYP